MLSTANQYRHLGKDLPLATSLLHPDTELTDRNRDIEHGYQETSAESLVAARCKASGLAIPTRSTNVAPAF